MHIKLVCLTMLESKSIKVLNNQLLRTLNNVIHVHILYLHKNKASLYYRQT